MYYWRKINIILFLVLLMLLIPSVHTLLKPGFIVTDDAGWMVIRLSAFYDTLKDGQIPARLLERLNNGYGYPVSNFLYPGFLYVGTLIHVIGIGFVDSIKAILALSMIFSGIFSYLWLKKVFDPYAAFIGSLFYVYTPYHLYDLYTRGSVGEILALVWIPFILWNIERKSMNFTALGIFLLIISHNSLALLVMPLIIAYAILQKSSLKVFASVLLGLLMSSFFIIPALTELTYTKFSSVTISNPFEYFAPPQLVGYSTIVALLTLIVAIIGLKESMRLVANKGVLILFIFISLLSIFLSTQISEFVWRILPSQFIQFPYRALSLLIVSISFIVAFVISKSVSKVKVVVSILLLAFLTYSALPYLTDKGRTFYPDEYYSTNMDTTTVKNEYMPIWVNKVPEKMPEKKVEVIRGSAVIEKVTINSRKAEIELTSSKDSIIRFNHIYYPGWKAYMNNERIDITYDNDYGVMDVGVSREGGRVIMVFEETPLRYISNVISVVALFFWIFLLLRPVLKFK